MTWPNSGSQSATSAPESMARWRCSLLSMNGPGPARAGTSNHRSSMRSPNGWATRSTTRRTEAPHRPGQASATRPLSRTAPIAVATATRSCSRSRPMPNGSRSAAMSAITRSGSTTRVSTRSRIGATNRDALESAIEAALAAYTRDEVTRRLEAADIPYGDLNSIEQFSHHPQLAARDRWQEIATPGGPMQALRPPFGIRRPGSADGRCPRGRPAHRDGARRAGD